MVQPKKKETNKQKNQRNSPCSDGCQHLEEEMKSHKTGGRSTYVETVMEVDTVLGIFAHCPRSHILSRASLVATSQVGFPRKQMLGQSEV